MTNVFRQNCYGTASGYSRIATNQHGMVLLIAMIMVLLMTIIGLAAIRGTGLQEMMAGNMRDMQLRFQGAEGGAAAGEMTVRFELPDDKLAKFNNTVAGFRRDLNIAPATPVFAWGNTEWASTAVAAPGSSWGLPSTPRFVVEEIFIPVGLESASTGSGQDHESLDTQPEGKVYRVSSRYSDESSSGRVLIQTLYKR